MLILGVNYLHIKFHLNMFNHYRVEGTKTRKP